MLNEPDRFVFKETAGLKAPRWLAMSVCLGLAQIDIKTFLHQVGTREGDEKFLSERANSMISPANASAFAEGRMLQAESKR